MREGDVFHVRELNEDGTTGMVLLQHRAGLIPVGNKARHLMTCPTNDDREPVKTVNKTVNIDSKSMEATRAAETIQQPLVDPVTGRNVRIDGYARNLAKPNKLKRCNTMDVGFRNMAGTFCLLTSSSVVAVAIGIIWSKSHP